MVDSCESVRLRPRTAIFGKRVSEVMNPAPPLVTADHNCDSVVRLIAQSEGASAVVVDQQRLPVGIVTEQDVVQRAVFQVTPDTAIDAIMTCPVHTIESWDFLYHAIGRMLQLNLRHLPVVDTEGRVVGTLDFKDAIAVTAERTVHHIRQLTWENGLESIGRVRGTLATLAEELLEEELDAVAIQRLITHVNNDIYVRLARWRLQKIKAAGAGDPPVAFCLLVMGSAGRGENFLYPDQDHGLILDDYPDDQHDRIDGWFREFAEGWVADLETVGFPRDIGYVMALNPMWRKPLSQWQEQTRLWAKRGSAMNIRLSDIFFDFQPIFGEFGFARQLRQHINTLAQQNISLLRAMAHKHQEQGVALGWFDRFITMGHDSEFRGHINIKHTGTLPLVSALRLLALKHGITATGTLERLEALNAQQVINEADFQSLNKTTSFLADLILRHQLARFKRDEKPNYYIHPQDLNRDRTARLKRALKAIQRLRDQVSAEIGGPV
jgi:signal-transduction protein with cAMP-binding, CBS, and nucleotidyltransferase domain